MKDKDLPQIIPNGDTRCAKAKLPDKIDPLSPFSFRA